LIPIDLLRNFGYRGGVMPTILLIAGVVTLSLVFSGAVGAGYVLLEQWMEKHGPSGPEGL
jgi:hypothetical protein